MIKYRFNNGKEYPLIQDGKLIAKLNKRSKICEINKDVFFPAWHEESAYYIIDLNLFHGARSEIYDYWFSDKVDQYWEATKVEGSWRANIVFDLSITPIATVVHKKEVYFFCVRHDETAEPSRLWFKLDDGVTVNG
mgnify:CR=1 FL=1